MIRRTAGLPVDHYAIIPNQWMRDDRLSWKARGLLAHLMTHSVGWQTSLERLSDAGPDGRDAVRSGLRELEDAGYLVRVRARNEDGTLAGVDVEVRDPWGGRETPTSGNPTQAEPTQAEPTPKKNSSSEDQEEEDQQLSIEAPELLDPGPPAIPASVDRDFVDWYEAYPRKVGKQDALRAYKAARRRGVTADQLLQGVRRYPFPAKPQAGQPDYRPHPASWLNKGYWDAAESQPDTQQDAKARRAAQGGITWQR